MNGRMKKHRTPSTVKSRLMFLFIAILFALLCAEYVVAPIALMCFGKPPRSLTLLGFYATPNTRVSDTVINSQGFTGHVLHDTRPTKSTVRILTLGGSSMFNRRMTMRLIESLSKATATPLEIQGGALRTHTTRSSLIKYEQHFYQYDFDYVLIYHGINDLQMNHVAMEDFKEDYSHDLHWYKRNAVLDHSLIARLVFYTAVWKRPNEVRHGAEYSSSRSFERNLRELVRLVRRDRGTPVLMTFSWHIPDDYTMERFVRNELNYNNPTKYDMWPVELWGSVDYVREGLTRHNAIIRKLANDENVLMIDQQELMGDNIYYFGDPCHFSEEGTALFIHNITEFFLSEELLTRRRTDAQTAQAPSRGES